MLDSLVGEAAKPGNVNIEAFDIGVRELHDLETAERARTGSPAWSRVGGRGTFDTTKVGHLLQELSELCKRLVEAFLTDKSLGNTPPPPPPTTGPQLPAAARQDPLPPGLPNGPGGNASHYLHCPPHEPRHGQRDGGRHHAEKMDLVCGLGIELVTEEHDRRPKWYCASQVVGSKLRRTGTDPQWQATTADSLRVDGNPLPPNHPPAGPHLGDGSGRRSSGPAGQVSRPPPPTAPSRLHCGRATSPGQTPPAILGNGVLCGKHSSLDPVMRVKALYMSRD
ncbi:uncharacterized protein EHS24_007162 [Apiotrichum porosum]|uniref:Uncharacterized protein n=1 Tax=Apiotrichum porosum TaxID=105984 RepID=A0A427XXF7_9TREE|nr:uncharacterized protein EHS24_007162 [Apiotrichum porosum]RSH83477.1 hypothetical protein EHS24_007162 [Apiotrichum porosum]